MNRKIFSELDLQAALDNLALIAALDLEAPPALGLVGKYQLVTSKQSLPEGAVQWFAAEGPEPLLELLDFSYQAILNEFYKHEELEWEHKERIGTVMALAGESAKIMDRYLVFQLGRPLEQQVEDRPSFKALQEYYREKYQEPESPFAPPKGVGFKDFESVRRDTEYELFYIRNEEGEPYFDAEILRNIKLTVDFQSESDTFEEDPLLKVRAMQDRDLHASSGQVLLQCQQLVSDFFHLYRKTQNNEFAEQLSLSVLALLLANNPRYLLQNTTGKSCLQYHDDFLHFLRAAMQTAEYQKLIAYPPDKGNKLDISLLHLAHSLCRAFFTHSSGVKQEAIGLIHRSMRRGKEFAKEKKALKGDTLWNQLQIDDENLRSLLGRFPNGPLFKILDLIREEQDEDTNIAFDPMAQGNLPSRLFGVQMGDKMVDVLRLPCPTRQSFIHKAEIVEEFRGFMRGLHGEKRLLLVNLQNRDSWKEGVRSRLLENIQKRVEFATELSVITLAKDTDFYHQSGPFSDLDSASDFIKAFQFQLERPEESGFYFPQIEKRVHWDKLLKTVHHAFFKGAAKLDRENRQDFIEISYQLIIFKAMESVGGNYISFTCKDAIDTGSAQAATFFGFLRLLSGDFSKAEDQDFLRYLFYAPALFLRERAIDIVRLNRGLSCLEKCDRELAERGKAIVKELAEGGIILPVLK